MGSVIIRVSPETKQVLDNMKAGVTVEGRRYYQRQMKYDDAIALLLKYKADSMMLDTIGSMLHTHHKAFKPSLDVLLGSFGSYLKSIRSDLPPYELAGCDVVLNAIEQAKPLCNPY